MIDRAKQLRKDMTEEEKMLWERVRNRQLRGYKFFRQKPFGNYIVDFVCKEAKLVVEVDKEHHCEAMNQEYDAQRDVYLKGLGFRVLRIRNRDVKKRFEDVISEILRYAKSSPGERI